MKKLLAALVVLLAISSSGQMLESIVNSNSASTPVVTRYYGYGCNGTTTQTCTVGGSNFTGFGESVAIAITTGSHAAGYTVQGLGVYFASNFGGQMQGAVYVSGGTTSPVSNCVVTGSTNVTGNTWIENTLFSGCSLAASTTYYIVYQQSGSNPTRAYDATGTQYTATATFGTFASTAWSSSTASDSMYIRVTEN
jgi:hypothetical protein